MEEKNNKKKIYVLISFIVVLLAIVACVAVFFLPNLKKNDNTNDNTNDNKQTLENEVKDDNYFIELLEDISPQNTHGYFIFNNEINNETYNNILISYFRKYGDTNGTAVTDENGLAYIEIDKKTCEEIIKTFFGNVTFTPIGNEENKEGIVSISDEAYRIYWNVRSGANVKENSVKVIRDNDDIKVVYEVWFTQTGRSEQAEEGTLTYNLTYVDGNYIIKSINYKLDVKELDYDIVDTAIRKKYENAGKEQTFTSTDKKGQKCDITYVINLIGYDEEKRVFEYDIEAKVDKINGKDYHAQVMSVVSFDDTYDFIDRLKDNTLYIDDKDEDEDRYYSYSFKIPESYNSSNIDELEITFPTKEEIIKSIEEFYGEDYSKMQR